MRNSKWNFDVIGVLASDEYVATKMNGGAVFVNRQNSLQFSVQLISETPEDFPNNSLYTAMPLTLNDMALKKSTTPTNTIELMI
ncbi:hypothetical protein [Heliorestis convoluta]|uniref:AAA family ATPase n=1 Tax=Heliorestis convoluta TaxID=356322 RepID=A0A5Q2N209_9FIRM|nr:hypothetical protein [Heliorestis convoluta]QGG47869.1 AAA family ATPase [Heliorestis convoluta]